MSADSPSIFSRRLRRTCSVVSLGFGLMLQGTSSATAAEENTPPSLNEKVTEALTQKMKPLTDAKNWDGALAVVDGILATVDPESYDNAYVSEIKANIYLQQNLLAKAIAPKETVLRLADAHKNYFEPKAVLDILYLLSQLYYQEGSASKSPAIQQEYFNKASSYIKRWLQTSPKKNPDVSIFYASILYNQAVVNSEKVDMALIKQARHEVEEGLLGATKPKDGFYMLLLASLQQEGDFARSAEVLELLVKQKPDNKVYWQQLMATYLNIAGTEKNEVKVREYYARSINSLERAQALGLLKDPKDNYNLVTIYYNAGQFGRATDLLYDGLKKGLIESDVKNWQLLAYSYQQVNQEFQAVSVLREAGKKFPTNGQLDFQIGQIFMQMDNHAADAYEAFKSAVAKGSLDKPYLGYLLIAYTAFDLQKYAEALEAVKNAETKFPADAAKDVQLPRLKLAIEDAIKEQDATKAAAEEGSKN